MEKCSQNCGRPAVVNLAGQDLCQQCAKSFRQIVDGYNNVLAVQYNHLLDLAEAGAGIPSGIPRMPVTRPAAATVRETSSLTYKHIDPSNADIPAVNEDGQLDRIDLSLEILAQERGASAELSKLMEGFVTSVLSSNELRAEDKRAITHVVSTLLTQLDTPGPRRMPKSVLTSIYHTLLPLLRDKSELVASWNELAPKLAERLELNGR